MRKWMLVSVLVMGLLFLTGCDPEDPKVPNHKATKAAPAATPARPNPNPDSQDEPHPGQQPPPPNADPGPYNDIHQVVVRVWWIGERGGFVTILVNGNVKADREPVGRTNKGHDGRYHGGYLKVLYDVSAGNRVSVHFDANGEPEWMMIAVYYNAKTAGAIESGQPGCMGNKCALTAVIR